MTPKTESPRHSSHQPSPGRADGGESGRGLVSFFRKLGGPVQVHAFLLPLGEHRERPPAYPCSVVFGMTGPSPVSAPGFRTVRKKRRSWDVLQVGENCDDRGGAVVDLRREQGGVFSNAAYPHE